MPPGLPSTSDQGEFPSPVTPDVSAEQARQQRLADLTRVTILGICVRLLIIAVEFFAVWLSGSSTLFVDAIASLFDILSSLVVLAAICFAARPPDKDHPFGHGRAEPLAGLQLGLLLTGTGVWMLVQNISAISNHSTGERLPGWLWIIPACATILLWLVTRRLRKTGEETRSSALRAEAMHFQVDTLTSAVTTITLITTALWASQASLLDHLGAGLLAIFMIFLGGQSAFENVHQLLDRAPEDEDFDRVRKSALNVSGVLGVEKLQIQHAGPDAHVNIDIEVNPLITVADSHLIAQQVRAQIQSDWPFVLDVIVHVEPYYEGDH